MTNKKYNENRAVPGGDFFFIFEKEKEVDFVKINIQLDNNDKIVTTGMKPSSLNEMIEFLKD